jgi:hypothetical protein
MRTGSPGKPSGGQRPCTYARAPPSIGTTSYGQSQLVPPALGLARTFGETEMPGNVTLATTSRKSPPFGPSCLTALDAWRIVPQPPPPPRFLGSRSSGNASSPVDGDPSCPTTEIPVLRDSRAADIKPPLTSGGWPCGFRRSWIVALGFYTPGCVGSVRFAVW